MNFPFLVIEGNIGAGKTSLATSISFETEAKLILERFAENPFLPKFYEQPERFAFPLELSFLADRYNQLKMELVNFNSSISIVSDYYFLKSLIFAQVTLENDEFQLYQQVYNIINAQLSKPTLYVYLHQQVPRLMENIKKRGRPYEQKIPAEYLQKIENGYFTFFNSDPGFPVLIIDISFIDFVENKEELRKLFEVIKNYIPKPGVEKIFLK